MAASPDFPEMGAQAAAIVGRLLDGASPATFKLAPVMATRLTIDWRQAQRWGIADAQIPDDAVVQFRQPTFWETYRTAAILIACIVLLQGALITALLLERRRRRKAEVAVQVQRNEIAHASRLAVAGELTASIAHEINQPLGAILASADAAELILQAGGDRREDLTRIVSRIRRDDLRASDVIRRLRALLVSHEAQREPFDLAAIVDDVATMLEAEARRRQVTLEIRPMHLDSVVMGDPIQLQQVLLNLILNAMDAVADAPADRRVIVVEVTVAKSTVSVSVRDGGPGIARENLPKVFESFFSTKKKGMGLGLSIARTIVEAHGGRIKAENGPVNGAVFRVDLPASAFKDVAWPSAA